MSYDLVIKNGTVVDGSGSARYRADVAITDGKIAKIGRVNEKSKQTIDAEGHVVSPGFVDGHTHMDAQIFWDPIGSCSSYHGVTSVVMGNCGFTLAPCKQEDADLVFRNLERAEDLSRDAMLEGIDWTWETFPEFLDTVDDLPKGINYAGYIGHSALRTYTMGERAFEAEANEDEVKHMQALVKEAMHAGAIGFSTSRTFNHTTADDRPVASRLANWEEVRAIVNAVGETGKGIFEIAGESPGRSPERNREYHDRLRDLAVESGVTQTWGMFSVKAAPEIWRPYFDLLDETAAAGGRMFAQVHSRGLNNILSFESATPYDNWELWSDIRALPMDEQKVRLGDPATKAKLVEIANREYTGPRIVGAEIRPPDWDYVFPMDDMSYDKPSMAQIAKEKGVDPVELMIDMALERDLKMFFRAPIANENQDHVLEMIKHPRSVVTFSDSGAHVSQIMDSSLQTHLLSHWVREKQALTLEEAVKQITYNTATLWGLHDRGLLREGMAADVVVFDPETIGPNMPEVLNDLPAGAMRLKQTASGILNTVVNGEIFLTNNEHSGATAGQLLRS
ncbi:MAG: amidohydrolase family protein [Gammaproteobacteria bacterium]|jgi:N-acyl-D-aspartate/D-glutamate deacylase|nr:amidohydrolase family protein [Gammaproteobacteria bacterium]MBT3868273.1 amidohydrolase family protein [Gammaproteobacteria bacterium]MBT4377680.1 amidohydrolase family protein [Gammaproteobacteria bacterium]MBT4618032.1 amidohydrolase family protein [Gammaproteobacteria bacterium]MBT5196857.1 amidohydrolase family protein [Gammaproteobacteria bacterium]